MHAFHLCPLCFCCVIGCVGCDIRGVSEYHWSSGTRPPTAACATTPPPPPRSRSPKAALSCMLSINHHLWPSPWVSSGWESHCACLCARFCNTTPMTLQRIGNPPVVALLQRPCPFPLQFILFSCPFPPFPPPFPLLCGVAPTTCCGCVSKLVLQLPLHSPQALHLCPPRRIAPPPAPSHCTTPPCV